MNYNFFVPKKIQKKRKFLPFSKEPLCGKTKENSPLFNKLVSELVNFEVVKF
jgi:hypothetical protein